ncbi:MAG TPA: electron transport complex subunit RsxC [Candidatus Coprenecus pullistercoris]|nr:electron transport complex subunit RsxC [Candidatus Coprenecus pullistercoris]
MRRTFSKGGVHPADRKLAADSAIEILPLPQRMYISMSQHLGAPAQPLVQKGDRVRAGQLIGASSGFISANIHSSVSGTVVAVEPYADLAGNPAMHVIIDVEGDEWEESIDRTPDIVRDITMSPAEIVKRIADCGVVGLGGASFPTHVKLSPPPGKKADVLIVNGAECEPYLTSDYRLMLEHAEEVLLGARIMMKALGVTKGYIGIEDNKPEAIRKMRELTASSYPEIEVVSLRKKYPQGGEKQLIDAVTGRRVPSMGLPIDAGAVVQNVGTAFAVYEAVQKNKPLFEGVMTVTGECLDSQRNFRLRVGTPFGEILEAVGGIPSQTAKIISGGPMMGKAVSNIAAASVKSTSSLLLLTEKQTKRRMEGECIRCGKCVEACPMGLEPYLLNKLARAGHNDELERNKVYDCIECGCCMFTCPANIPLLDYIRTAKADVMRIMRGRPKK